MYLIMLLQLVMFFLVLYNHSLELNEAWNYGSVMTKYVLTSHVCCVPV